MDLRIDAEAARNDQLAAFLDRLPSVPVSVLIDPPAAGPEFQIGFELRATTAEIAERCGRRMASAAGLSVLASRAVES